MNNQTEAWLGISLASLLITLSLAVIPQSLSLPEQHKRSHLTGHRENTITETIVDIKCRALSIPFKREEIKLTCCLKNSSTRCWVNSFVWAKYCKYLLSSPLSQHICHDDDFFLLQFTSTFPIIIKKRPEEDICLVGEENYHCCIYNNWNNRLQLMYACTGWVVE